MSGHEIDDGRWQVPVKLFGGAGELEGRGQRSVLTILQLLRDDIDTDLVVFEAGYGQQDCALPQVGGKLLNMGLSGGGLLRAWLRSSRSSGPEDGHRVSR